MIKIEGEKMKRPLKNDMRFENLHNSIHFGNNLKNTAKVE